MYNLCSTSLWTSTKTTSSYCYQPSLTARSWLYFPACSNGVFRTGSTSYAFYTSCAQLNAARAYIVALSIEWIPNETCVPLPIICDFIDLPICARIHYLLAKPFKISVGEEQYSLTLHALLALIRILVKRHLVCVRTESRYNRPGKKIEQLHYNYVKLNAQVDVKV